MRLLTLIFFVLLDQWLVPVAHLVVELPIVVVHRALLLHLRHRSHDLMRRHAHPLSRLLGCHLIRAVEEFHLPLLHQILRHGLISELLQVVLLVMRGHGHLELWMSFLVQLGPQLHEFLLVLEAHVVSLLHTLLANFADFSAQDFAKLLNSDPVERERISCLVESDAILSALEVASFARWLLRLKLLRSDCHCAVG